MAGRFKQHRRLAADDLHIGGFVGIRVAYLGQLQYLTFGDHVGRVRQDLHDLHVAQRHHHLEGAGIEKVAHQHAGRITPQRVGGRAAAAQIGGIDHVVVQQGGGVQEFDDGCECVLLAAVCAAGARAKQHHQWTQAFAARADDIVANLFHKRDPGVQLIQDQLVDRSKVSGDRLIERQRAH